MHWWKRNEHGYIASWQYINEARSVHTHTRTRTHKVHRNSSSNTSNHRFEYVFLCAPGTIRCTYIVQCIEIYVYIWCNPFLTIVILCARLNFIFIECDGSDVLLFVSCIRYDTAVSLYKRKTTKLHSSTSNVKGKISTNKSGAQKRKTYLHRFKSWRQPKKKPHTHTHPSDPSYR